MRQLEISEKDFLAQVKRALTGDSLIVIIVLCLTKIGKPAWRIPNNIGKRIGKNDMMNGISGILLAMPTRKQINTMCQASFGRQILKRFWALPHDVIIAVKVEKIYLFASGKKNLRLTMLSRFIRAV